ncbi:DddA-like double-stranded DNA deaminase toxin [Plantactinospora sp. BB1]|uniref:DddA-like double-stranded DNA deaminase toxin n=1 Tax=Plantactinospora sp. BB1 TaxID=2071627 RepID=UPI000D164660|nr:DddA-like double-stranded DNA deaminase toxin [Plantactinospora sp. BB1]AVT39314.1 hypothetical protein C6W10_25960 [Plantactinospora sp. BB1]
MSLAQVAASLSAVLLDIAGLRAQIAANAKAVAGRTETLVALTQGSRHPSVEQAIRNGAATLERLREADQQAAGAVAAIVEYGRAIGIDLPAPAQPGPSSPPPGPRRSDPEPSVESAPSDAIAAIGRRLPVRAGARDRTTGMFAGELVVSGEDPATIADLRPLPGGGWPDSVISHVESHVAARMRRQNLREGEVVLNNITCGNRGFDADWPATCERYIRDLLPAGSRLTVWATPDGGATWWTRTYRGTGERIKK